MDDTANIFWLKWTDGYVVYITLFTSTTSALIVWIFILLWSHFFLQNLSKNKLCCLSTHFRLSQFIKWCTHLMGMEARVSTSQCIGSFVFLADELNMPTIIDGWYSQHFLIKMDRWIRRLHYFIYINYLCFNCLNFNFTMIAFLLLNWSKNKLRCLLMHFRLSQLI